jgi:8-oxo-dGTP pyrophosphatase MutT (NUDIX family)
VGPNRDDTEPVLISIDHDHVAREPAEVVHRSAVRAVIRRGDRLLMVHGAVAGDYKFPGGGLEPGESPLEALVREVSEECGRSVTRVGEVIVVAVEHRRAREPGTVFRMESAYHRCEVGDTVHGQSLDTYEHELGFTPVWVRLEEAIEVNERVIMGGSAQRWVIRETQVLHALRDAG